jgi:hypothetical protein
MPSTVSQSTDAFERNVPCNLQHRSEAASYIYGQPRELNIELRRRVLLNMQTAYNSAVIQFDKRQSWELMSRGSLAIINSRLSNHVFRFTSYQPHLVMFPPPKGFSTTTDMLIWIVILRPWVQEAPPSIIEIPDWSVSSDSPWRTSHTIPYSTAYGLESPPAIHPTPFSIDREDRLKSARLICANLR